TAILARDSAAGQTTARFLNNNDTGARFITRYGAALTRVAAVLQHTVPGVPIVYLGDEVGAAFEPYDDHARLDWSDPHQLSSLYRKLAELRESLPALSTGTNTLLNLPKYPAALAFMRGDS